MGTSLRQRLWGDAAGRWDLLLALAVTLLGVVVYWQADQLPPPFFDPLGSAAVPKLVALILIGLSVAVVLDRLRGKPGAADLDAGIPTPKGEEPVEPAVWTALASIVLPVLYVAAMQAGVLAFAQASTLLVLALGALFARFQPRLMLALVPIAFIAGYGLDYLFTNVLYVDLPQRSLLGGG